MPVITLPDGATKAFDAPVSVLDVAASIGSGLAKATLAGKIDGQLVDADTMIDSDASISLITDANEEGTEIIRHSCAHLLAQAVKQLFPSVQITIGPVIAYGFYYDISFERSFTPEDLEAIEKRMKELAKQAIPVTHQAMSRDDAIKVFEGMGEDYKVEIIRDIPADDILTLYTQGDFTDLCRGPHVPNTSKLKAFKLTKLAGAYWRGDSNNEMLQRIYGVAFAKKEQLKEHIERLEEAEKRDHRRLAKVMDLYHMQEEAQGVIFWHEKGWRIYNTIEQYMRRIWREHGYKEIKTPTFADRSLWEKSGHWEMFGEDMFSFEADKHQYAIKPMSCPLHLQVFNQGLRSYRELPLRLAEFGCCHRNELSGALHGIMRVRGLTQDDAHIFCTDETQVRAEAESFIRLLLKVYQDFGFTDVVFKLSTRPEKRVGSDDLWDKAEQALGQALDNCDLQWSELPGEGAFYGPKIEFSLKDCIGRLWQCGTLQLDYCMPERLGAQYVAEDGTKQVPIMLHRAIFGSLERFIGILIEHYAGNLPFWLAPVQGVVMPISDKTAEYATEIEKKLRNQGFHVLSDLRNEKVGYKIREHTIARVPYLLVVGEREAAEGMVSVRTQAGEDLGALPLSDLIQQWQGLLADNA
ncbi:MAG: threonine--tRNA ligase [marine bacterium B5-7]|nr:MAG: threonine--tRNA ligase [marine bacterium B5-7]